MKHSWRPVGGTCAPAGQELEVLFRQVRVRVRTEGNSNLSFCTAVSVFPCVQWGIATPAGKIAAHFGKELARKCAAGAELQGERECNAQAPLLSDLWPASPAHHLKSITARETHGLSGESVFPHHDRTAFCLHLLCRCRELHD